MFQCSSASRKFLNLPQHPAPRAKPAKFQCSSASRKFLNRFRLRYAKYALYGFSALQRAENSSIYVYGMPQARVHRFQCSSASRKFLNSGARRSRAAARRVSVLFSEPKIPQSLRTTRTARAPLPFQCSSASRKFLNQLEHHAAQHLRRRFSALQRAENSSISWAWTPVLRRRPVSVLFSEPKIPQCRFSSRTRRCGRVSVLFSEPKIPQ